MIIKSSNLILLMFGLTNHRDEFSQNYKINLCAPE